MIVAVKVPVWFGAIAGNVSGVTLTSQPVGGAPVRVTSVIGAVPPFVTVNCWVVGPPAEPWADSRLLGVERVIEYEPVTSMPRSAVAVRSPACAVTLTG